jgi:hypothetical protein
VKVVMVQLRRWLHRHPYRPSGGSGSDVDGNGDIESGPDGRGRGGGSIAGWVAAVPTTVVKCGWRCQGLQRGRRRLLRRRHAGEGREA